jgi:hypothetical protein
VRQVYSLPVRGCVPLVTRIAAIGFAIGLSAAAVGRARQQTPERPPQPSASPPQSAAESETPPNLTPPPLAPADLRGEAFYASAKPYLDDPGLKNRFPELHGLKPAHSQEQLIPILDQVGAQLLSMVRRLPDVVAHERVTQVGHFSTSVGTVPLNHDYSYLILAHRSSQGVSLDEYRTELSGKQEAKSGPALDMLTGGYALTWSRFYPSNRSESRFRYLGNQKLGHRQTFVIAFAQKPGWVKVPGVITIGDNTTVILDQGIAWIDQSDYRILYLRLDMLAPRPDIHVQALVTEIQFGEALILQLPAPLWLPQRVDVFLAAGGEVFHNIHRYSDYRLFAVHSLVLPAPHK